MRWCITHRAPLILATLTVTRKRSRVLARNPQAGVQGSGGSDPPAVQRIGGCRLRREDGL